MRRLSSETDEEFGHFCEAIALARRRLLPLFACLFFFAYVDRSNVSFAASAMQRDLGMSDGAYGFAAGIFFVAYSACQVPANLQLLRFGPRRWLGFVTCLWAGVAACFGALSAAWQFPALRLCLGAAEAGLVPGVMMYLTQWFPPECRAAAMTSFGMGSPLSSAIGGPLSEYILQVLDWRHMFVLESAPVLLLGLALLRTLPDTPADAVWLSAAHKEALKRRLGTSSEEGTGARGAGIWDILGMPSTWTLGALLFSSCIALYGVQLWLPKIMGRLVRTRWAIGVGVAVPYTLSVAAMVCGSAVRMSASRMRRTATAGWVVGSAALALSAFSAEASPWFSYICMSLSVPCYYFAAPPLLAYIADDFEARLGSGDKRGRAIGIAATNCIGHLGAFLGPYMYGLVSPHSGTLAILSVVTPMALTSVMWGLVGKDAPSVGLPWEGERSCSLTRA